MFCFSTLLLFSSLLYCCFPHCSIVISLLYCCFHHCSIVVSLLYCCFPHFSILFLYSIVVFLITLFCFSTLLLFSSLIYSVSLLYCCFPHYYSVYLLYCCFPHYSIVVYLIALFCWWWCRPHPVREHAQDLRPPLGARPASPPTRQAAQPPPWGPSTNPRPLV